MDQQPNPFEPPPGQQQAGPFDLSNTQQPNPFDPSPKPAAWSGARSARPSRGRMAIVPLILVGFVVGAIGFATGVPALTVLGLAVCFLGLALHARFVLLPMVANLSIGSKWSIRIPPGAIPEDSPLESTVEDRLRRQLEQSGVHLTDDQLRKAIEHGTVVTSSITYRSGSGTTVDSSGARWLRDGKTIDPAAILANGAEATATIEGFEHPTGGATPASTSDLFFLTLEVSQPGGEPRRVTTMSRVPAEHQHLLTPGNTVPVKVSRDDPDLVAVDWSHVV